MSEKRAILVVDDELDLVDNVSLALEVEGFQILTAHDGFEALNLLKTRSVDLILADIAMPGMNGYQLFERVRQNPAWMTIPFIFLSARSMDSDIRFGKELGVDDYLAKPIRAADLVATVRGKLRRAQQLSETLAQLQSASKTTSGELKIGQLKIDLQQYQVWLSDEEIKLSAREFALLKYLGQRPGAVISPVELVQVTHDLQTDPVEAGALLRPLILSLRRKLGLAVGQVGLIENVRGVGYRLAVPDLP
jgi:DNA-binding response OmpR family regulator